MIEKFSRKERNHFTLYVHYLYSQPILHKIHSQRLQTTTATLCENFSISRYYTLILFAVLAGSGETSLQASGAVAGRSAPQVLRQVLHARSGAARGGVHALPVLSADQARPGPGTAAVQRQHCRSHGQLYSSRLLSFQPELYE